MSRAARAAWLAAVGMLVVVAAIAAAGLLAAVVSVALGFLAATLFQRRRRR